MADEPHDADLEARTVVAVSVSSSYLLDELVAEANVRRVRARMKPTTKRQALDALLASLSKESALSTLCIQ